MAFIHNMELWFLIYHNPYCGNVIISRQPLLFMFNDFPEPVLSAKEFAICLIWPYIFSGAEKPSRSTLVSSTSLVRASSPIRLRRFASSSSARILVS